MNASAILTQNSVITHATGIYTAVLDGTLLIAPRYGGQGHCMDPVGTTIWESIAEPRSIRSLCRLLCDRYSVDSETCSREVMDFVADLLSRGLIVIIGQTL
jgi:hypothetical protein